MAAVRFHIAPNAKIDDALTRGAKRAKKIAGHVTMRVRKAVGLR